MERRYFGSLRHSWVAIDRIIKRKCSSTYELIYLDNNLVLKTTVIFESCALSCRNRAHVVLALSQQKNNSKFHKFKFTTRRSELWTRFSVLRAHFTLFSDFINSKKQIAKVLFFYVRFRSLSSRRKGFDKT